MDYYRENLMLFYPWRREISDEADVVRYWSIEDYQKIIGENRDKYFYKYKNRDIDEVLETAMNEVHKNDVPEDVPIIYENCDFCLLYTSPSPRDRTRSRMPSSA